MISFRINHLTVIIIELMHDSEITISDTYNNNRNRQPITGYDKIDNLLFIMNFAIGDNEQDHILIIIFLKMPILLHRLLQEFGKLGRSAQGNTLQHIPILLEYFLYAIKVRIIDPAIDRKAMMHLSLTVKTRMVNLRPKPVHRHKLIIVIVHQYASHLIQCLLVNTLGAPVHIVQTVLAGGGAVTGSEVDAGDEGQLQVGFYVVCKGVLDGLLVAQDLQGPFLHVRLCYFELLCLLQL